MAMDTCVVRKANGISQLEVGLRMDQPVVAEERDNVICRVVRGKKIREVGS